MNPRHPLWDSRLINVDPRYVGARMSDGNLFDDTLDRASSMVREWLYYGPAKSFPFV